MTWSQVEDEKYLKEVRHAQKSGDTEVEKHTTNIDEAKDLYMGRTVGNF